MEILILIILVLLLLAFIGKSIEFVKRLIEFLKRDDIKNMSIGGVIISIAVGIFFGNIAFFITLALFIAMLYFEYKKSSPVILDESSSKSGFLSSVSQTFQKLKNDVVSDNEEIRLRCREA